MNLDDLLKPITTEVTFAGVKFKIEDPPSAKGAPAVDMILQSRRKGDKETSQDQINVATACVRACVTEPDLSEKSDEDIYRIIKATGGLSNPDCLVMTCMAVLLGVISANPTPGRKRSS